MEDAVKQRIRDVLAHFGTSQYMLADGDSALQKRLSNQLNGTTALSYKTISSVVDRFPDVSKEWLLTGEGSMLKSDNRTMSEQGGVPYYNVDFTLGFDLVFNDQTTQPDYYINFAPYNRCDCWINARGDSMSPTISSGDIVALQKIEDIRYLISGEIYAVVTKNGLRTIKRINDMGDSLKLIPDNKAYEEQVISKEELLAVFYVKGNVKAY